MELLGAKISDYKSIRSCEVPLSGLTVLLGQNGAGKSNVIEALAMHDPAHRADLASSRRLTRFEETRVGLVVRLESYADGAGPDQELLRELIAAQWLMDADPTDLAATYGAYCGSAWWLYSEATLNDEYARGSLRGCLDVVKESILFGVMPQHLEFANRLVCRLFDQPVLIIQEDFAVELSCDANDIHPSEAFDVDLDDVRSESAFYDLIRVMRWGDERWKPLIRLSTCLPPDSRVGVAGFDWAMDRFGGIAWLSGDVEKLEAQLDSTLPGIHDKMLHRPSAVFYGGSPDSDCQVCMAPDHGGRIDPSAYEIFTGDAALTLFDGNRTWLEEHDGWVRIRPSLRLALAIVEEEANRSLPQFVSERGVVRLKFAAIPSWNEDHASRCEVHFAEFESVATDGELSGDDCPQSGASIDTRSLTEWRVAELGQGLQRWIATAVRIAIERCADGEVALAHSFDENDEFAPQLGELSYVSGSARPRILLMDEPEQHLHIAAQHQAALWCMSQARQNHAVLVASHSSAFSALPPERATTCMVTKKRGQTEVQALEPIHGPDAVKRAQRLGIELGMGQTALAQFTRAVLIVEGDWDRRLLYAFFERDLAAERVLVVPLQGSDELLALADAAVIPALGLPVVALLDEVRAASVADIDALPPPLSKAERGLRDLSAALGDELHIVRYEDPDVICALPETAVRRAFPGAIFPGWTKLLEEWADGRERGEIDDAFKKWALRHMGLSKKNRYPPTFFRSVLDAAALTDRPGARLQNAVKQALAQVNRDQPS